MRRTALYSRSPRRDAAPPGIAAAAERASSSDRPAPEASAAPVRKRFAIGALAQRHERWLVLVAGLLIGAIAIAVWTSTRPGARLLTQKDIDGAVLHTLATQTLPSRAAKAYEAVRPSIVKVVGTGYPEDDDKAGGKKKPRKNAAKPSKPDGKGADGKRADGKAAPPKPSTPADDKQADKPGLPDDHPDLGKGMGVGTGVVIVDSGVILTNLHVVLGASKLKAVFFAGFESEATVIGMQPETALAVLTSSTAPSGAGITARSVSVNRILSGPAGTAGGPAARAGSRISFERLSQVKPPACPHGRLAAAWPRRGHSTPRPPQEGRWGPEGPRRSPRCCC